MTGLPERHEQYGGIVTTRAGTRIVAHYGRPERTYRAVRNGAGVIEHGVGTIVVKGAWREQVVAERFSNELPDVDAGQYGFIRSDGSIVADAYVFTVEDRVLAFVPPDRTDAVVDAWSADGVLVRDKAASFAVFGVYGPEATEKVASVCSATTPETALSIDRGAIQNSGVTVVRDDGVTGEEGYLLIAAADDADDVFDALVNRGPSAAPFGYETWETLTLEAGTPLFETELRDVEPGAIGITNAFPPGERPARGERRLRAFTAATAPTAGTTVYAGDRAIGEVTRARAQPKDEGAVGFAMVETDEETVTIGDEGLTGTIASPPFVEGSDRSARLLEP
ncbi:aminomethyl transferase family protein [Halorhabdus sp. CBA1104]|uniref:aminomethyltransferase family protein n=1 Tax=Halorhabdus sp. CBA1104 TaxID=1380432 RepID=UPI0012B32E01|nr:aminomethyltransferase family protein [Halorhabdus sp. CBA1104]QGN06498.1 aminomethyl transferase family protein [Halorhabdus sp. CBA1104]